jgi:hypothetical protein
MVIPGIQKGFGIRSLGLVGIRFRIHQIPQTPNPKSLVHYEQLDAIIFTEVTSSFGCVASVVVARRCGSSVPLVPVVVGAVVGGLVVVGGDVSVGAGSLVSGRL